MNASRMHVRPQVPCVPSVFALLFGTLVVEPVLRASSHVVESARELSRSWAKRAFHALHQRGHHAAFGLACAIALTFRAVVARAVIPPSERLAVFGMSVLGQPTSDEDYRRNVRSQLEANSWGRLGAIWMDVLCELRWRDDC